MVDLSKVQGRQTQQDQVTRNRPQTIYVPDQPDAPKVQVVANLRDTLPDSSGQAAAIRQVLGLADNTLDSFNQNVSLKGQQQAQQDAGKGAADQAAGTVDPELQKRSLAYSLAVGMGNARTTAVEAHVKATQDAQTFLAQNPNATLDDLNAHMEQDFRSLLLDKDGHPVDFGHPEANAYLYKSLAQTRAQVLEQGANAIRSQMQEKGAASYDDATKLAVMSGQAPDIEGYIEGLGSLGIDAKAAKTRLLNTLRDVAMTTQDASVLSVAHASRRADGTPSFSPQEQVQLLESYHVLNDQFRAEHEKQSREDSATVLADSYEQMLGGKRFTAADLHALRNPPAGQKALRPEDADNLLALQDHIDNRAYEQKARARADIEFGWAAQNQAFTQMKHQSAENAGRFMAQVYATGASPGDAMREAVKGKVAGAYDDETFGLMVRELRQLPSDGNVVRKFGAQDHEVILNDAFSAIRRTLPKNPAAQAQFSKDLADAQTTFYRGLRNNMSPSEALAGSLSVFHQPKATVDAWVHKAEVRQTTNKLNTELAK